MPVELSFIIPALGNSNELRECLKSIFSQNTSIKYEVLVAFCEQDKEVDLTVKDFEFAKALRSPDYMLAGKARNLGAQYALADIFAFVDSDCVLDSNWTAIAIQTIQDGAVLCSGTILDKFPWNLIASSDNRLQYADFAPRRPYGTATYFPGAHLAVRRDVFEEIGGFDNSPPAEDILFTMPIAKQWPEKTIFNPKMIAYHSGRTTLKELMPHQELFGYARAYHGVQVSINMIKVSQRPWLGWIFFLRRFIYITLRVIQWNVFDLFRYFFQLPFIMIGLVAWVKGFYRGMKEKQ